MTSGSVEIIPKYPEVPSKGARRATVEWQHTTSKFVTQHRLNL